MVQPLMILLLPLTPVVVGEVADPLIEKGTHVVDVVFAGTLNVQLLNWLLSAWFHR